MMSLSIRILGAWLISAVLLVGSCLICLTPQAEGASHDCCRAKVSRGHCDKPAPAGESGKDSKDCPNEKLFLETAKKPESAVGLVSLHPDFMALASAASQEVHRNVGAVTPGLSPFQLALVLRI